MDDADSPAFDSPAFDSPASDNVVQDTSAGAVVQAGTIAGSVHVHGTRTTRPVPRQLPAAPAHFVGRDDELAELTRDLGEPGGTVLISALAGAGGIGKTALALWWAHRNADRFPDGQLFVDLQGFSPMGEPMDPGTAVRGFLGALGGEPAPAEPQAQAALYRSLVADKRMLVVLDNVADTDQVTPLLPGSPTCMVLVTSRRYLSSLITRHGARHLPIGVLSPADARRLLTTRVGADRTDAEPAAVDELLDSCGGFALALSVVAARAIRNPATPLAELATELRDAAALDDEEPTASLPAVLSWSLRTLSEEQNTTFALFGIAPGTDITLPAAARLTGLPLARIRRVLRVLADASLLDVDARGRYSMHNLIRGYAAEVAAGIPEQDRTAALRRVVDFYLHTAYAADRLFYPHRPPIRLDPPPGVLLQPLPDMAAALAWLDAERANLLAVFAAAAEQGWGEVVWQLTWSVNTYLGNRGDRQDLLFMWRIVLALVDRLSDPAARILVHRNAGRAFAEADRHDEGIEHLGRALELAESHGDVFEQSYVQGNLMWAWTIRGDHRKAIEHGHRNLDISRSIGDPVQEANALHGVGWCAAHLGDYDEAQECSRAALVLHQAHHHRHGEAVALSTLAYVAFHTGRQREAAGHYVEVVELYLANGNTRDAATTLEQLGECHVALDEDDKARMAWQEALALYRTQGRTDRHDRLRQRFDDLGGSVGEG